MSRIRWLKCKTIVRLKKFEKNLGLEHRAQTKSVHHRKILKES